MATLQAGLDVALRAHALETGIDVADIPMDLAVIGMGRLGGGEMGFGSDADVLFVHRARDGADEGKATAAANAVAHTLRRLLGEPAPDPAFEVDADLRPEGRQGALVRSLSAFREYYERWVSVWEVQALLRAVPVAGDERARRGLRRADRPDPLPGRGADRRAGRRDPPDQGAGGAGAAAARRRPGDPHQARPRRPGRRRVDRPAAPAAARRRRPRAAGGRRRWSALAALGDAGLLDAEQLEALRSAWELATRARNAIFLVRGRPSDQLPRPGLELAGVARACGYGPDTDPGQFLDDYRRTTRHARSVVEQLFYGGPAGGLTGTESPCRRGGRERAV